MTATPIPMPAPAGSRPRGAIRAAINGGGNDVTHLARLRWAVRAVLTFGVTASIAANVLHARPDLISQIIAAWPPLALLLTVELISRVPAGRRWLANLRLMAAAAIAGIAAWVSYWHMAGVAARYGETGAAASYLLPISVDGRVVVASISLVEIAGRIRTAGSYPQRDAMSVQHPPAGSDRPGLHPLAGQSVAASPPQVATASQPAPLMPPAADVAPGSGGVATPGERPAAPPGHRGDGPERGQPAPAAPSPHDEEPVPAQPGADDTDAGEGSGAQDGEGDNGAVPADTAAAVAYWHSRDPSLHPGDVATRIGRSERTVRRYWPPAASRRFNGA